MTEDWPSEDYLQQACLNDCLVKYDTYEEWWNNTSSGVSRLIRKLFVEDYLQRKITWIEYEQHYEN